jgi:hypothetical protein
MLPTVCIDLWNDGLMASLVRCVDYIDEFTCAAYSRTLRQHQRNRCLLFRRQRVDRIWPEHVREPLCILLSPSLTLSPTALM